MMDSPCGKFGGCIFSRFGFYVRTDRQRDRQNHTQTRMIAILMRLQSFKLRTKENLRQSTSSEPSLQSCWWSQRNLCGMQVPGGDWQANSAGEQLCGGHDCSSLRSPQSLSASQTHDSGVQRPFAQLNSSAEHVWFTAIATNKLT